MKEVPLIEEFTNVVRAVEMGEIEANDAAHLAIMIFVYLLTGVDEEFRDKILEAMKTDIKSAMTLYPKALSGELLAHSRTIN